MSKTKQKFPYETDHAQVGDVIMSEHFAKSEEERRDSNGLAVGEDFPVRNPRRAKACFVVEETGMTGGGKAMFNDEYPDGWEITARRLKGSGAYDEKGELIRFYQSGCFNCMIKKVTVVGKMRRIFV